MTCVFFLNSTLLAVISVWYSHSAANDTSSLIRAVVALIANANQRAGTHVRVADYTLAITYRVAVNQVLLMLKYHISRIIDRWQCLVVYGRKSSRGLVCMKVRCGWRHDVTHDAWPCVSDLLRILWKLVNQRVALYGYVDDWMVVLWKLHAMMSSRMCTL